MNSAFFNNCAPPHIEQLSSLKLHSLTDTGLSTPSIPPVLFTPPLSVGEKITSLIISDTPGGVQKNIPFTFGLSFKKGAVPKNSSAVLQDNLMKIIPSQAEIKATRDKTGIVS